MRHQKQQKLETLQSSASERLRYMPKTATIHYLNVCHSGESRSIPAKNKDCSNCLTSAILANMNVLAQVIGVLEPENRKVGQGVLTFFAKVKVTYFIYPVRQFQSV